MSAIVVDPRINAWVMAYLTSIGKAGPRAVATSLNMAADMWKREVVRHCPVDKGLLRASIVTDHAEANRSTIVAQVGTNVEYAKFLEFGTDHIAKGEVKRWQPGDAPILDWPAKRRDLPERSADIATRAFDANTAEFMPPWRGSWQLIAPRIVQMLQRRLAAAIKRGAA